jgi:hypothetical protein
MPRRALRQLQREPGCALDRGAQRLCAELPPIRESRRRRAPGRRARDQGAPDNRSTAESRACEQPRRCGGTTSREGCIADAAEGRSCGADVELERCATVGGAAQRGNERDVPTRRYHGGRHRATLDLVGLPIRLTDTQRAEPSLPVVPPTNRVAAVPTTMKYCHAVVPPLNRLKSYVPAVDVYVPEPPSIAPAAATETRSKHTAAPVTRTSMVTCAQLGRDPRRT